MKREQLWEEVTSLLTKGTVEVVQLSQDLGRGVYFRHFLATKHIMPIFALSSISLDSTRTSVY